MFYKLFEDGSCKCGNNINLPDGTTLSINNKGSIDGWVWYDEEPQEYLDWLENLNNDFE